MLNAILATVTLILWSSIYGLFFARDIRRWWRTRHQRRARAAMERAERIAAYAAWTRNIPPPRSRVPVMPVPLPEPYSAQIVPFPRAKRRARR
jgi:hypothetical protein